MSKKCEHSATDEKLLVLEAYKTGDSLRKRRSLYEFAKPRFNIEDEVIDLLRLTKTRRLIDIGCGEGRLLLRISELYPEVRLTGLDISPGIFENVRKKSEEDNLGIDLIVGNAQEIPFADNTFDRVTALHMLYHVPDIGRALQQIRRIMKSPGVAVFTANSLISKPFLKQLTQTVTQCLGLGLRPNTDTRFNIESGKEILEQFFPHVDLKIFESILTLNNPQPYIDYFDSLRAFWYPYPENRAWNQALYIVQRNIAERIKSQGFLQERNVFGAFVAKM